MPASADNCRGHLQGMCFLPFWFSVADASGVCIPYSAVSLCLRGAAGPSSFFAEAVSVVGQQLTLLSHGNVSFHVWFSEGLRLHHVYLEFREITVSCF